MYDEYHGKAWAEKQGDEVYGIAAETSKAASLRRAHSAEFPSPPRSRHPAVDCSISSSSSSDGDEFDETASLKSGKRPDQTRPGLSDVWSPIMCQKFLEDDGDEAASFQSVPYVHPPAKRPLRSLSDWSLEICTERLGSENGSDGFFSCPSFEPEDDSRFRRFGTPEHCASVRKPPPRSFPPPLSSFSSQIQSRRENGRLVIEAVSQPSPSCLRAERHGGRLLLSLVGERNGGGLMGGRVDVRESEKEGEKKEAGGEDGGGEEVPPTTSSSATAGGVINAHRMAITVEKPLGRLAYRSKAGLVGLAYFKAQEGGLIGLAYRKKCNQVLVDFEVDDRSNSQPPRRRVARLVNTPATNDECHYHTWKGRENGASSAPALHSLAQQLPPIKSNKYKPQVVLLNGVTTEHMVPLFRGCYPPPIKRSVLIWKPYLVATSS